MSSVHIIYLTSECNFNCKYCFQKDKKSKIVPSLEDLKKIVDSAVQEKGQTSLVFFGGEPLLEYDKIEQLMAYAYSKKKFVHFQIITNGYMLSKPRFLFRFSKNIFLKKGFITTVISFDGLGNSLRTIKGNDSTNIILGVFKNLKKLKIKYDISYTVNALNVKNLYQDLIHIRDNLKPERIIINIDRYGLTDNQNNDVERVKQEVIKNFTTPVCYWNCEVCRRCIPKTHKKYYTDKLIRTQLINDNVDIFKDF